MTIVVWAIFGMTLGAAVLHVALGLTRPLDRTYLSFAFIMALLGVYVVLELDLYSATTSEGAIEATRRQVVAAHGLLAFILVFVPAYTRVELPRWLRIAFWGGLVTLFFVNLVAPYGLWYGAAPELRLLSFGGEEYTAVVSPPLTALQLAYVLYVLSVFALTFVCAILLARRELQRGITLALALVVALFHYVVDVVRDEVGGTWPYVAEFGLVTWGLIMSVQLAVDYRASERRIRVTLSAAERHARELARLVETTLQLRDKLNTPLQTFELSVAACTPATSGEREVLAELEQALWRIAQLGRAVEDTTAARDAVLPAKGT